MSDVEFVEDKPQLSDQSPHFVAYSNLAAVNVTAEELILTFAERRVGTPNVADPIARIYLSHSHALRLLAALAHTLERFQIDLGTEIQPDPAAALFERMAMNAAKEEGEPK